MLEANEPRRAAHRVEKEASPASVVPHHHVLEARAANIAAVVLRADEGVVDRDPAERVDAVAVRAVVQDLPPLKSCWTCRASLDGGSNHWRFE